MAQVKLNLQPPPNVDFVSGYPGIPPGPDRPQASVKGAIEVRVPAAGVKAKWVRIELRKVETLPGGGTPNTFYDFVGPSPVNLWTTPDEYGVLRSQDFPFSIRIPESIPPTIALENRAGIAYELLASVCTKGKKGFLRKAKSVVVSTSSPIIIDKHELHSTWPVYCQPEKRQLAQDGVNLIVERSNTCYGPGDRISVKATVKSDSVQTVILRGFEFYLKEATVYRAGIHAPGKKSAPQTKQMNTAESKVPVNTTLYGGTSHTSDLSCMISPEHTTTTLNAARHIDVTYTLCIKAVMGTGTHLVMDLPVIISNWQRNVSFEAINRIGPVPNLSLIPPTQATATNNANRVDPTRGQPAAPASASATIDGYGHIRNNSLGAFNTLPAGSPPTPKPTTTTDEFGYGVGYGVGTLGSVKSSNTTSNVVAPASVSAQPTSTPSSSTSPGRRPVSASKSFVVTNPQIQEWPSAEQEKVLYEQAKARAQQVQGVVPSVTVAVKPRTGVSGLPPGAAPASIPQDEKRLFKEAQQAVNKTQKTVPQSTPPVATVTRNKSDSESKFSTDKEIKPTGAALYAQAINAQNRKLSATAAQVATSPSPAKPPVQVQPTPRSTPSAKAKPAVPHYLNAEQEKAALKLYEEAKSAVDRTQFTNDEAPSQSMAGPVAYESLFPAANAARGAPAAASSSHPPPPPADAPPPFESAAGGSNIMAHLSEKERLRRQYEEQDAAATAALARQNINPAPPPPAAYSQPPAAGPLPGQYANALEEKEAMRKKFEERDKAKAAKANKNAPQPPPRTNSVNSSNTPTTPKSSGGSSPGRSPNSGTGFRPTPVPPPTAAGSGSSRVLTAVEEKAMLRAKYEARDAGNRRKSPPPPTVANGSAAVMNGTTTAASPSTPPPLMPRPPVEYIMETQDEDARLSRLNGQMPVLDVGPLSKANGSATAYSPSGVTPLDMKPFTPFRAGFDTTAGSLPGPPPPLPHQS